MIAITAAITCLLTNTVRDIIYVNDGGEVVKKVATVRKMLNKYCIYDFDESQMADYAALGMSLVANDPYTRYFSKDEFTQYKVSSEESYVGIGVIVSANKEDNVMSVVSPYEDSPSEKAGVRSGDIVCAVDGVEVSADNINEIALVMRGDGIDKDSVIGSKVILTLQRDGGEKFDVVITREIISKNTVKSKMMDGNVGYIRITNFDRKNSEGDENEKGTDDLFKEHLSKLQDESMEKLIIDLRGNPGGDLEVMVEIADILMPSGIIVYTEDKEGNRQTSRSDENEFNAPIVVLVNEGSASASEALSGALKDSGKAKLVGEKTYGKGIAQTIIPFSDGSGMMTTFAKYYTPSGVCIHGIGIEPDYVVKAKDDTPISQLALKDDVQLQKALEVVKSQ